MIEWKDDYNIGVDAIDDQHRKLFEIAGRAMALLKNEMLTDKFDKIVEILEELKEYTVYHFRTEEEYMQSIKYKRFLSQKAAHDEFIQRLEKIDLEHLDDQQDEYLMDILNGLVEWISEHILGQDKLITAG